MSDNRTIKEKIADRKTDLLRYVTYIQKYENELSQLNNSLIRLQQSGNLTDKYKREIYDKIKTKKAHLTFYKKAEKKTKEQIQKLEEALPPPLTKPDFVIPRTNPPFNIENPKEEKLSEDEHKLLEELKEGQEVPISEDERKLLEELKEGQEVPISEDERKLLDELEEEQKVNAKKAQQQQQNLLERERIYEEKTGKKYNPLITDDDDTVSVSEPDKSKRFLSSSKTKRKTPTAPIETISSKVSNKTKEKRPTPEGIELVELSEPNNSIPLGSTLKTKHKTSTTPIQSISSKASNKTKKKRPTPEGIELVDLASNRPVSEQFRIDDVGINEKHFVSQTGFRETLKPLVKKELVKLDENICQNIITNGLKVNKGHFFPSQFPKLTRIKPITLSKKKGGKRKTRKRTTNRKNKG